MSEAAMVLTSRIDDALRVSSSTEAVSRIKEAVYDELRLLDQRAEIRQTRFFNHSFYPDMFVTWHDGASIVERPVYLRLATAEQAIQRDLEIHAESPGVFVGLLTHRDDLVERETHDADAVTESDVSLITDAKSVQTLRASVSDRYEGTAATSTLVRVGRGRFDGDRAESVSEAITQAFSAASAASHAEHVRRAVDLFEAFVDPASSARLSTHLQLLWLASGGDLDDLFGPGRLAIEQLEDDQLVPILQHLLTTKTPPSVELFRRFSQVTDVDKIARLLSPFSGGNLDAFVEANIGRWGVKRVAVIPSEIEPEVAETASPDVTGSTPSDDQEVSDAPPALTTQADSEGSDDQDPPSNDEVEQQPGRWMLDKNLLKLRVSGAHLAFTNNAQRLPPADTFAALLRTDFSARMADDHAVELELMSDEAEVSLRSRVDIGGHSQVRADQIEQLGALAKYVVAAEIESPGLTPPGDEVFTNAHIEFARGRVKLDTAPSAERAARFVSRYFDLGETPRTA